MAKTKSRNRLTRAAKTGIRELPANAAWVLSKAIQPVANGASQAADNVSGVSSAATDTVGAATSKARQKAGEAGRTITEAVPGLPPRSTRTCGNAPGRSPGQVDRVLGGPGPALRRRWAAPGQIGAIGAAAGRASRT